MSVKDIICDGWLVKSPPTKGVWRGRWRKRWFTLYPGEFPQQYVLAYYTDRNCRKLKGTIDLSHCEQVDVGFKYEDKKFCNLPHIFAIKTEKRTYYLAAETEKELQNWTKCVCDVCGLKPTNEDEVEVQSVIEEPLSLHNAVHDYQNNFVQFDSSNNSVESPPMSPVSTSPYIPISECITGKSPVFFNKGIVNNLYKDKLQNSCDPISINSLSNLSYEGPSPTYHNFVAPPMTYEIPRSLLPRISKPLDEPKNNSSPLQSPVDSDSVFTDDTWSQNTITMSEKGPRTSKFSDSSADMDAFLAQRVGRLSIDSGKAEGSPQVPPRPPKPAHISQGSINLNVTAGSKTSIAEEVKTYPVSDDMYDFPRSHQVETENSQTSATTTKRHCYNNAAPTTCGDGQIFRYDGFTKAGTSSQDSYDTDTTSEVPPSPSSQCSSSLYSNLPSPNLTEQQLTSPPPVVNRGLKPKRKLSDTLSITSNPEPSSPRLAPNVDRNLKPPLSLPSPDPGLYTNLIPCNKTAPRKKRSAPSPLPLILRRSFSDLVSENEQVYHQSPNKVLMKDYFKLEYLDLDFESLGAAAMGMNPGNSPGSDTVYKAVDFVRTEAFNATKINLEKERRHFN